jgi:tetratricopeptide (TPR) repeat protein
MVRNRRVLLACAALAASAVAAAALIHAASRPRLPQARHYAALPPPFDAALASARRSAESSGDADAVRLLALLYQANRLLPEARACYRVIAASRAGLNARDHYYLAAMALDESDSDQAIAELRASLALDPAYAPATVALADALFRSGRPDEAAKAYQSALEREPDQPQALLGLARVDLQRGDDKGAVAHLRLLVSRHPESTTGTALLAQVLGRLGDAEEAEAMTLLSQQGREPVPSDPWRKELLIHSYDPQRIALAFEQYRLSGQMDEALPLLDRMEELDPKGSIAPMLRGWSLKKEGRYAQAVEQYRVALANGGDPERICPLMAAALISGKDLDAAAAMLADYHARLPHSMPILLSYAEVAVHKHDDALARDLLSEVLKAEPYLYMPNMSLVQILWSANERDAAADCLRRVARVYPADVDSRGILGQYYMEKSDPWSAVRPLQEALANLPKGDPRAGRITRMLDSAYLAAGSLEASQGHFGKAVAFAEKSIALLPDGLRGYSLKMNASRQLGDTKGVRDALLALAALEPSEPSFPMGLGDLAHGAGADAEARAYWQKALDLAPPGDGELRSALEHRLAPAPSR